MRIAFTGGGTGGHVYPALEVLREIRATGAEVRYFGSLRGVEGQACQALGVAFEGFPAEPLVGILTPKGVRAATRLLRASSLARRALELWKPDALFSTGGYSAAPVVRAARSLGIPYVLFESDSVPGRSNRFFERDANSIAIVFERARSHFRNAHVVRTGMPIRAELRRAANDRVAQKRRVLVVGGSKGSAFLNELLPGVAAFVDDKVEFLHVAGREYFERVEIDVNRRDLRDRYRVVPYLEAAQMADAYLSSAVVVGRSGSSLAEFALFGLPSVLIPLPTAMSDHQTLNALEFESRGAATHIAQKDATTKRVAEAILNWLDDEPRTDRARQELARLDAPDATTKIADLIRDAARKHA